MFPKLLELGPVTLHWYGLLLALALLAAVSVAARLAEKDGIPRSRAWDLGFVIVISAIIGAKLLMIVTDLQGYLDQPSRLLSLEFWQAGGVYYGGLMGAILGSALYIRRYPELEFWKMADAAAPAIALGQSIGRVGCFAAGCDYGLPTGFPWAVTFTSEYARRYVGVPLNVPLHPSQLYESGATFLLFLLVLKVHARRRFSGQTFFLYLFLYGALRFGLEFFRGDIDRGFVFEGTLSTSQFISLVLVPVAVYLYLTGRSRSFRSSRV